MILINSNIHMSKNKKIKTENTEEDIELDENSIEEDVDILDIDEDTSDDSIDTELDLPDDETEDDTNIVDIEEEEGRNKSKTNISDISVVKCSNCKEDVLESEYCPICGKPLKKNTSDEEEDEAGFENSEAPINTGDFFDNEENFISDLETKIDDDLYE